MSDLVDITKPVVTRDGRPVESLEAVAYDAPYTIRGRIVGSLGYDTWTPTGRKYSFGQESFEDIMNEIRATFDPAKPVQTRDGKPVRIIATDADGERPIVVLIRAGTTEMIGVYKSDGTCCAVASPWDLINKAPEKKTFSGWVVAYADGGFGRIQQTREQAILNVSYNRKMVACVQLRQDYEVGEGL